MRGKEIYAHIIRECDTDAKILHIKRLIDTSPFMCGGSKASGRTIDSLTTQFAKTHDVAYYLKKDPHSGKFIIADEGKLFDIQVSYAQQMNDFSKEYFDCFSRGHEVKHLLKNGEIINMSLCQFMFFIWGNTFQVFEFP